MAFLLFFPQHKRVCAFSSPGTAFTPGSWAWWDVGTEARPCVTLQQRGKIKAGRERSAFSPSHNTLCATVASPGTGVFCGSTRGQQRADLQVGLNA